MADPASAPLKYVDHIEGAGVPLFGRVCELDLEGIVAKHKYGPYVVEREQSTWFKIRNPAILKWWAARNYLNASGTVSPSPVGIPVNWRAPASKP
jgi:hypothetical protein